jgi:hypothetical protein
MVTILAQRERLMPTKLIVALNEPTRNGDYLGYAKHVAQCIESHPDVFATPRVPRERGVEIIALSGLCLKRSSGHGKPAFAAKRGRVSGSVHIVARAERTRAAYDWQYGTDGVTWTSTETTTRADQWLYGLTPGVEYFFRYRVSTKGVVGDWSQVVSLLVV